MQEAQNAVAARARSRLVDDRRARRPQRTTATSSEGGRPCTESAAGTALPPSEVLRVAVGARRVRRDARGRPRRSRVSARGASGCSRPGTASCPTSGSRPMCASRPTASRCASGSCARRATSTSGSRDAVERRVTTRTIEALARSFDPAPRSDRRDPGGSVRARELLRRGHARAGARARRRAVPRERARARPAPGDARRAATGARGRDASTGSDATDLAQAPLARTVTYMLIGLSSRCGRWRRSSRAERRSRRSGG